MSDAYAHDLMSTVVVAGAAIFGTGASSADLCRPLGLKLEAEPQRCQILHLRVADAHTGTLPLIVPVLRDYYLLAFPDSRVATGATRESRSGFDYRLDICQELC